MTTLGKYFSGFVRFYRLPAALIVAALALFLALPQPTRAAGFWTTTGSLQKGRSDHTATLLPNGQVLVAGGYSSAILSRSAELYDPAKGTWTLSGDLNYGRQHHTATLLPDGKVLVAGNNREAELYDPNAGTWAITGSLKEGRYWHTATLLPNGKVLVAGGYYHDQISAHYLASAELYDPATGTWTDTGPLSMGRANHTATLLPNGQVLVAGGYGKPNYGITTLASTELYDPASGKWTDTGYLHKRSFTYHTATLLGNGQVLAAGYDCELYQVPTWSTTGSLHTGRNQHTAALLPNGQVLVAGGAGDSGYNPNLTSAELYDPAARAWTNTGSLHTGRYRHTATLLPNGQVLVAGGFGDKKSAELYGATQKQTCPSLLLLLQ